eukprot:2208041-Rhodomonas_salina.1
MLAQYRASRSTIRYISTAHRVGGYLSHSQKCFLDPGFPSRHGTISVAPYASSVPDMGRYLIAPCAS